MPASIAHMVIVHKAFELLRTKGSDELREFARMIDDPDRRQENDYWKYMNLGSIGPDLYYYASMIQSGWDMLMEGFVKAAGVVPWSYHLHSSIPNEFPLSLCRVLFSDVVRTENGIEMDADDRRKLGPKHGRRAARGHGAERVKAEPHPDCRGFEPFCLHMGCHHGCRLARRRSELELDIDARIEVDAVQGMRDGLLGRPAPRASLSGHEDVPPSRVGENSVGRIHEPLPGEPRGAQDLQWRLEHLQGRGRAVLPAEEQPPGLRVHLESTPGGGGSGPLGGGRNRWHCGSSVSRQFPATSVTPSSR